LEWKIGFRLTFVSVFVDAWKKWYLLWYYCVWVFIVYQKQYLAKLFWPIQICTNYILFQCAPFCDNYPFTVLLLLLSPAFTFLKRW
jgi:hypothetical protein